MNKIKSVDSNMAVQRQNLSDQSLEYGSDHHWVYFIAISSNGDQRAFWIAKQLLSVAETSEFVTLKQRMYEMHV